MRGNNKNACVRACVCVCVCVWICVCVRVWICVCVYVSGKCARQQQKCVFSKNFLARTGTYMETRSELQYAYSETLWEKVVLHQALVLNREPKIGFGYALLAPTAIDVEIRSKVPYTYSETLKKKIDIKSRTTKRVFGYAWKSAYVHVDFKEFHGIFFHNFFFTCFRLCLRERVCACGFLKNSYRGRFASRIFTGTRKSVSCCAYNFNKVFT